MYCTKCGNKIHKGDTFCNNCGMKLDNLQGEERIKDSSSVMRFIKKNILSLVIILLLFILIIIILPKKFGHDEEEYEEDEISETETYVGTNPGDFEITTSLTDAFIQNALFERNAEIEANVEKTKNEYNESTNKTFSKTKDLAEALLNNGQAWYDTSGKSKLVFNDDGTYAENWWFGSGAYSITDDSTLVIDKTKSGGERVVCTGTISLTSSLLSRSYHYDFVIYRMTDKDDSYCLVFVDTLICDEKHIYYSDLNHEKTWYETFPDAVNYPSPSFEYDTTNGKKIEDNLFKISYNVILCVDDFLQGNKTIDESLEAAKVLCGNLDTSQYSDNEQKICNYIASIIAAMESWGEKNTYDSYSPIQNIRIYRAKLLVETGMQQIDLKDY